MKRFISAICAALLLTSLIGCTQNAPVTYEKPEGMSQETFDLGLQAVELIQSYLDGKITTTEAYDKVKEITASLDSLSHSDPLESANNLSVRNLIAESGICLLEQSYIEEFGDELGDPMTDLANLLKEIRGVLGIK